VPARFITRTTAGKRTTGSTECWDTRGYEADCEADDWTNRETGGDENEESYDLNLVFDFSMDKAPELIVYNGEEGNASFDRHDKDLTNCLAHDGSLLDS